jgi:hypothetical protein
MPASGRARSRRDGRSRYGAETTVLDWRERLVCSRCGSRQTDTVVILASADSGLRCEEPEKNWKFSASDLAERGCWDDYMAAYEQAIAATAAPHAPWFVGHRQLGICRLSESAMG